MTKPKSEHKKVGGVRHRMGRKRPYHKSMTGHHRIRRIPAQMYATVREAFDAALTR